MSFVDEWNLSYPIPNSIYSLYIARIRYPFAGEQLDKVVLDSTNSKVQALLQTGIR